MPTSPLLRAVAGLPLASLLLVAGGGSSRPADGRSNPSGTFNGVVAGAEARTTGATRGQSASRVAPGAQTAARTATGAGASAASRTGAGGSVAAEARATQTGGTAPVAQAWGAGGAAAQSTTAGAAATQPATAQAGGAGAGIAQAWSTPAATAQGRSTAAATTQARRATAAASQARSAGTATAQAAGARAAAPRMAASQAAPSQAAASRPATAQAAGAGAAQALADPGRARPHSESRWSRYLSGAATPAGATPRRQAGPSPDCFLSQVHALQGEDVPFLDLGAGASSAASARSRPVVQPLAYPNRHGMEVVLVPAAGGQAPGLLMVDPEEPLRILALGQDGHRLAPGATVYLYPHSEGEDPTCLIQTTDGQTLEVISLTAEPAAPPSTARGAGDAAWG